MRLSSIACLSNACLSNEHPLPWEQTSCVLLPELPELPELVKRGASIFVKDLYPVPYHESIAISIGTLRIVGRWGCEQPVCNGKKETGDVNEVRRTQRGG